MIYFTKGNLLKSEAKALVNTVNTSGTIGKGIALQFKHTFPLNHRLYQEACKNGTLVTGQLLVINENNLLLGERVIVNFPTKQHWKSRSGYIDTGLSVLRDFLISGQVESIAIPAQGCDHGG